MRITGFVERGIPKVRVFGLGESEETVQVQTVLELAMELKRETVLKKLKGTTRAKVIPFRKGSQKSIDW